MTRRIAVAVALGFAATCFGLAPGCGGSTSTDTDTTSTGGSSAGGGSAGSGNSSVGGSSGGTGGGVGGSGMSSECSVPSQGNGPYGVIFHLKNDSAASVYLWQGCELVHEIRACDDGYTAALATSAGCSTTCGSDSGCPECGACQNAPVEIAPGASTDLDWQGFTYTFPPNACCSNAHVAPGGKYRMLVSVYDVMPTGNGATPPPDRVVPTDFALAMSTAEVDVSLGK